MAKLKLSEVRADKKAFKDGVEIDHPVGGTFIIRSIKTREYIKKYERIKRQKYGRNSKKLDPVKERDILVEALVGTLLVGWKDIEDEKGKPIPYSDKFAYELLDGESPFMGFLEWVLEEAGADYNFRTYEAAQEKN